HEIFGNHDAAKAMPMQYLSEELWTLTLDLNKADIPAAGIAYNYILQNEDGSLNFDCGTDKIITPALFTSEEVLIIDSWNDTAYIENTFYTEPFKEVLLRTNYITVKNTGYKSFTHIFKAKTPLLAKGQTLCIIGNCAELGSWDEAKAIVMSRQPGEDFFSAKVNLSKTYFPIAYKYAVYDTEAQKIVRYENGSNRILYDAFVKNKKTIVNDGFAALPFTTWKGAGVAIPVFSLKSAKSCGIGEFTDLKLFVDWAKSVGLKLIQILPVNDTTATHTWTDSYPYAAISAFALHPMFLNLDQATETANKHLLEAITEESLRLNKLEAVDYEAVNQLKWKFIRQIYPLQKDALFASKEYTEYFEVNKHWLAPYAVFSYFRDKYNSADFNQWASHKKYDDGEIETLIQPGSPVYNDVAIHFFVQYYLHVQLKEATQYAHDNGIILKGDVPIGIYRFGADAWQHPELYHMDAQAGAPPDDFAVTGQNWGFPTYNWEKMREDGFAWWKLRFAQMSYYFDAFRIDHILGFFRIWSIPLHSVEGIMGHFEPSIPVHINEFSEKGIWFNYKRYCQPFINDAVLDSMFGDQQNHVKLGFLERHHEGLYQLKPEYATQRQIENYFTWQQNNKHNRWLKKQLFTLLSNVILFEAEGSKAQQFHFRFAMESTSSFKALETGTQQQLRELYINYFFRRQDDFWMHEALQKLPALKRETNMLVCGEDLGMVPACVPDVMRRLGILSLEIQRMPKDPNKEFFHPADAPYMSVVTPSTHDMSTIRGWWEEDRESTNRFYHDGLGHWGPEPYFCDAWINKAIVVQHLYSPAMWSIFQLQDILGIDVKIRKDDPHKERINVPANPQHYWKYRMHLSLEDLLNSTAFNDDFGAYVKASGRA
ncbi:MAG: 4-alpha-glucanotransferase, partial [Panacibacter sp.]